MYAVRIGDRETDTQADIFITEKWRFIFVYYDVVLNIDIASRQSYK